MNETKPALPSETGGTEITRFDALRHGVLSRYTVVPWENVAEYAILVTALVSERAPPGPTEEHLVEELAGVLWRKRRLRSAEAAAHRRGLEDGELSAIGAAASAKRAVVHIGRYRRIRRVARPRQAGSGSAATRSTSDRKVRTDAVRIAAPQRPAAGGDRGG